MDQKQTRYIDCSQVPLPYGAQLVQDLLNRTETAMGQAHCFLATEIILKAQRDARRLEANGSRLPAADAPSGRAMA